MEFEQSAKIEHAWADFHCPELCPLRLSRRQGVQDGHGSMSYSPPQRVRQSPPSGVAYNAGLVPVGAFIQIEIAIEIGIEIGIGITIEIDTTPLLAEDALTPPSQPSLATRQPQHCGMRSGADSRTISIPIAISISISMARRVP